ncbi:pyruvate carboxylase subunit a [Holotrichia oblita]|nr:pyruvate carboxylase subunit a [Holotrichia oblita]
MMAQSACVLIESDGEKFTPYFTGINKVKFRNKLADESYCIGGVLSKDSYLNQNNIISTALASGASAIHPGYGFLSENPGFAALCQKNGIAFIGPSDKVISKMGDKDMARKTMIEAGVPVIPGSSLIEDLTQAVEEAKRIGFPLLIKARSGGGGRGIRLVKSAEEFEQNYNMATQEALSAFGDGMVYMEKYLKHVKHIEMQILADNYGNVLCLGERDCSVQRKNQKLIEESPAVLIPEETRRKMMEVSAKAAAAANYTGAGTIEYLYDKDGNFYFMEMNTRLQVEHPVTEMITGIDLVKWQIRIAAGLKLNIPQDAITFDNHAIECRINAEKVHQGIYRASGGKIEMLHIPGGPQVRFDTAIYHGYTVPPFYDSMIGKLIVSAKTRDEAIRKMKAALCELIIEGVEHNAEFQMELLSSEEFENATYTTDLLAEGYSKLERSAVSNETLDELTVTCPRCKNTLTSSELLNWLNVCPYCRYHFRINTRQRLRWICDKDSFVEIDKELESTNIINFPGYDKKLENARLESAESDAVICGFGTIGGVETAIFVMEPYFMMGSMGSVVGEKITRLFEAAREKNKPVVGFTVSGGARMQEGILSLMQMAKTSGAVKLHSDAGNLFICVLTDPTTGGVTASFAMEADIIISEPFALIGFAGPRVIEQTIKKKLPSGFQRAEFLLERGFIDEIVDRRNLKTYITQVLKLHIKTDNN